MAEKPYDAGDEAQVRRRKTKAELLQEQQDADLCAVLSSAHGLRFFRRLLEATGVYQDSFNANALAMANNEGRRKVGLFVVNEITRVCPEKYLEILTLNQKEASNA